MIIGFDLDDVILDFHGVLQPYHNQRFGTNFRKEHFKSWYVHEVWECSKEDAANRILAFYESPEHWSAEPMVGSIDGIEKLKNLHDLYIVTAKPENLKERTLEWLRRYFPNSFNDVYFANHLGKGHRRSKGEIVLELGIEMFVDDSLSNAEDVSSHGVPVLLFDSPWNQGEIKPPITRVHSWEEIVEALSKR